MTMQRKTLWFDSAMAVLFALTAAWLIYAANKAAEDAIRRYGHNVDSGALLGFAANVYFLPLAVVFAFAALSLRRGWRIQWVAHWFAVVGAVAPLLIPGAIFAFK